MASRYKILGQVAPTDTNNTTLYTVASGVDSIISSIVIANVSATATSARVFVCNNGALPSPTNALVYDVVVAANSTIALTLGVTMDVADVLSVRSSIATNLTFHAFGQEIS
jgi:hypothetical protein